MKAFNPKRLISLRESLNLTQDAFAKLIDSKLERQHVLNWEKGNNGPTLENLAKISMAFNIPIDYFFGEDIHYGSKQCPTNQEL